MSSKKRFLEKYFVEYSQTPISTKIRRQKLFSKQTKLITGVFFSRIVCISCTLRYVMYVHVCV